MRALGRRTTAVLTAPLVLVGAATAAAVLRAAPAEAATEPVSKILTIIEENHTTAQMRSQMPYLDGLGAQYGRATHYTAERHPSEPNYLAIAGGSTFGVTDDDDPAANAVSGQSVFGQATAAGLTSGTYAESMPSACALTGNTDRGYAVKHNPQAYFTDERAHCRTTNRSTADFQADARADALPNVGLLVPNKCHDAHDCGLSAADRYLHAQLPAVLASSDFTSGRLAVVITADEDDHSDGNGVLTVVLQAGLAGTTVTTPLTHYSLSRMLSQVVGAPGLRQAASAPDMAAAFGLRVGPGSGADATPEPTQSTSPAPEPTETSSPTPEPTESTSPAPEPTETSSPTPEPTESTSPAPEPTARRRVKEGTTLRVSQHPDRSESTAVPADGSLVVSGKVYFFVPAETTTRVKFRLDAGRRVVEDHGPFDMRHTERTAAHDAKPLDTTQLADGEHRLLVDSVIPNRAATTYTFTVDN